MKEENEKQRKREREKRETEKERKSERDREWHVLKLKLIAQSDRIKCMSPFHFYQIFFFAIYKNGPIGAIKCLSFTIYIHNKEDEVKR